MNMKNYRTILLAALVAFPLAAACNKENAESGVNPGDETNLVPLTLSASGETDAEEVEAAPKVTFDDTNNARWENSDHIAVFDNTSTKKDFSLKSGTNTGTGALFEGNVAAGYSNLYTVYPYSAAASRSGDNVTINVPATQTVSSANRVDKSAIVSVGKVNLSNQSVTFKQVCGLVSFVIATDNIYKVIIEGANIAGTATVAAETGVLSSVSSASGKVTVSYSGGGNFPQGKYYAAVLPGTTAAGDFAVAFVHEDGLTERQAVSSAVTIARKGRKAAGTVTNNNPKIRHIYNKAQLDAWGEGMADDEQYFTVYLEADINYGSDTWNHTNTRFNGNFKGQGYKIYNIIVESATKTGFINELWGDVSDIFFGSSNGTSWDGVSRITHKGNEGAIEYVGLFSSIMASGTDVVNVVNFAPVSVPSGYSTRAFLGGLTGFIASGKTPTLTNSKNYGDITNNSAFTDNPAQIGGIVGQCLGAPTASGLKNYGNLAINTGASYIIGGLFGGLNPGASLSNSENHGSITIANSGSAEPHVGGCVGVVYDATISGCHNYGAVTTNRAAVTYFGGIVGRLMSGTVSVSNCTNHSGADLTVASTASSRVVLGGVVGACLNGKDNAMTVTIQDCKNEAAITNEGASSEIGGIAGMLDSEYADASHTFRLVNCENTGAVTNAAADVSFNSLGRELRIGGIIGSSDADQGLLNIIVRSCTNRGDVTTAGALTSGKAVRIGGISGLAWYDALIDKCKNFGDVKCTAAGTDGSANMNMGGIVGFFEARTSSRYQRITECVNTGEVSSVRNVGTQYIGGILGSVNNAGGYSNYGLVDGSKNYGAISATRQTNTMVGGVCGYAKHTVSNCSNFGNVSGGAWNGAILGDGNASAVVTTGIKVGLGVNVTGAANAGTKYSNGKTTYSYGGSSSAEKKWFSGWSDAAITVTVVDQETYSE